MAPLLHEGFGGREPAWPERLLPVCAFVGNHAAKVRPDEEGYLVGPEEGDGATLLRLRGRASQAAFEGIKAGQASDGVLQLAKIIIELPLEIGFALCFFRSERSGFCGEVTEGLHGRSVRRPSSSARLGRVSLYHERDQN